MPAERSAARTPAGLAPAQARDWLRLQARLALRPEWLREPLLEGLPPDTLLARARAEGLGRGGAPDPRGGSSSPERLDALVARLESMAVRVLPLSDPAYPPALAALVDAPAVLLVRGDARVLSRPAVAIVGARAATRAARGVARRLARELAQAGLTVVSGLARGIDGEAHRGALEAHAPTVGVLACGLDRLYPPEHRRLGQEMARSGAVISELPLGTSPRAVYFPLRNRIISGLCLGVVVVEARRRSGSLITVRHALAQGREVFVVPGAVDGPFAEGGNQLLREGARPIRCGRDVLEDLGLPVPRPSSQDATAHAGSGPLDGNASGVLARLADGPATRDELLVATGLDAQRLADVLIELELMGRVEVERDGRLHACAGS
ncbi:MAG: DNA-processing protein DprA [Myxococcota bacterium]